MVGIDACFLSLILHPKAKPPVDPSTKKPIPRLAERIEKLVDDWDISRERIVVPTPALAEFLILAGADGPPYLNEMNIRGNFYIKPFDQKAAIELAGMELLSRSKGSKRSPAPESEPWQKVRIDRQIIAIAKTNLVQTIYSDDTGVRAFAEDLGIKVVSSWELDLPVSKTPLLDPLDEPNPPSPPSRKITLEE